MDADLELQNPPETGGFPHEGPVMMREFPWASYQIYKITDRACARNAGNVFPPRPTSKETAS